MVNAGSFKNGVTFEMDGNVMQVVKFQHVKPGKGSPFVRTTIRNVITGAVVETTFDPDDKFDEAFIERTEASYSWNDGSLYYFYDEEGNEVILNADQLGESFRFVSEGTVCKMLSFKGNIFSIEPPNFMDLTVESTEPAVRGNTATNVTKPAILEGGAEIKVPLFIDAGDRIQVDTRTGEYVKRLS